MPKLYNSILETIGNTPIIKINKLQENKSSSLYAKLEYFNPGFSIKDRVALNMVEDGIKNGKINSDTTIIEPTSGNTGIGLSLVCAYKNLKLILVMPENMSLERQKLLKYMGAELILTEKSLAMAGAQKKACELKSEIDNSIILSQFDNKSNIEAHYKYTSNEIIEALGGHNIDYFIACVGSSGTITGIGKKLKTVNSRIKIIAVEPFESPLLSKGISGLHGIQGIGANFVPGNYDKSIIDDIITIKTEDAINMAKKAARTEGILCGISSGAALCASLKILSTNYSNKKAVTILPDLLERYMSTELFN